MTPRRTLLLIALFVAITFGSFLLYLVRATSADAGAPHVQVSAPA